MSELPNRPVVVDNRPGGVTLIASEFVAKSAPDSATLLQNFFRTSSPGVRSRNLSINHVPTYLPMVNASKLGALAVGRTPIDIPMRRDDSA